MEGPPENESGQGWSGNVPHLPSLSFSVGLRVTLTVVFRCCDLIILLFRHVPSHALEALLPSTERVKIFSVSKQAHRPPGGMGLGQLFILTANFPGQSQAIIHE